MKKVIIIAEAGVNHNGNVSVAKKLIDVASEAGVDYVKFQTFKTENLVTKNAKKAKYQIENTNEAGSQFDMLKKLELNVEAHHLLIDYCAQKNIKFLSTGFDMESLDLLNNLNIDIFKVPSGEITNLPYLEKVASFGKPVILSTGMCAMQEVKDAFEVILAGGIKKENVMILHCNTEYPTPMEDVNLTAMLSIKKELGVKIGYSDHTLGIEIPIAAVAIGASVIEKHFTLDRNMDGPDHKASLKPDELKSMVTAIRNTELALGDGIKKPTKSEQKNILIARKSIVAIDDINKGDIFTEQNISVKRPGNGISAMKWHDVLGTKADKNYKEDELIKLK